MTPSQRAFAVLSALVLVGGAGCTSGDVSPPPQAGPAQSASAVPSPSTAEAPRVLSVPPVTPDEISRVVYTAETQRADSVVRGEARTGQQYAFDAACTSTPPGRVLTYELFSSKQDAKVSVSSGELPCDGTVLRNTAPLPATAIQISLGPELTGVTSAYAIITPVA